MSENNIANINFQPLEQLKRANFLNSSYWLYGYFLFMAVGLVSAVAQSAALSVSLLLVGITLIFKAYMKNKSTLKNNQEALEEFAAVNNMTYTPLVGDGLDGAPGTLFMQGHSKKGSNAFTGKLGEWPFTVFRYDYATGSGKSRRSYDATVIEIELPRSMPHMVIDSLMEEDIHSGSVLPIVFDKTQKIDLEGDFYKYFSLYAPDTYGVSALTVIAPDAMQTLMEHAALCDIEIIDNKLYFYWPNVAATRQDYERVFSTVAAVLGELGKKLTRGDIYSSSDQAQIHSSPNSQGVRLKRQNFKVATILFGILYVGGQILSEMDNPPPILVAAVTIPFILFVAYTLLRGMERRRLLADLRQRYQNYRQI
jgi:hypothetical protein